ncbi:MAG: transketolase [Atopobiaceae bacterium]|nr:transketolase [Atopobiaceae bacterium]
MAASFATTTRQHAPASRRAPRLSRAQLALEAVAIRRAVVELAHQYPDTPFHLGGSLSCAEIFAVLLSDVMNTGLGEASWFERDRLVLSKGHASLALWPALLQAGFLSQDDYDSGLFGDDAVIGKQPRRDVRRGIELSGGSLGMGLGYACGLALAARRRGISSRVFCVMGDGECDEGSVWESASFAGHNRLDALTVIVDANGLQLDGPTSQVLDSGPLAGKFAAFGFEVQEVDGHDVADLQDALRVRGQRPRVVIAHTVKGKGLSFAEDDVKWHDRCLDEDGYRRAVAQLDAAAREVQAGE